MQQITIRKKATTPRRGLWCNLCGSPLSGFSSPAPGRGGSRLNRRVEWLDPEGRTSTWSLCSDCYRERLCCAACGSHVGNQAVLLEGEPQVYCHFCFEQRPRCDTCSRPVGSHYWARPDGRQLCDRCQSTSVSDPAQAHALYRRVRADLARYLGMSLQETCQLKLVSRQQLLQLIDKSSLYHLDADSKGRCFGLFIREGEHRAIFVEYGLPRIVLLEVLAHEFTHAWQSENCRSDQAPEIQEGFAEWVAYKLLENLGCRRRSERMLRRDDMYGRGLKRVLQWEKEGGKAGVFWRVRNASSS
ncbi:MAG TPA: protein DA1 [Chloroflexia bacterium]|nr:protein DA1 [Chloroflexia bacterium]